MTREEAEVSIRLLEGLTDKRLAYGKMWDETLGCGCVQGMLCPKEAWPSRPQNDTLTWEDDAGRVGFISLASDRWAKEVGLSAFALAELEAMNDSNVHLSPEVRYEDVLVELRRTLIELEDE